MPAKRAITRADILPLDSYRAERKSLRQNVIALKERRRIEVGPYATFYFENYQTMWHQVHEMLFIEKGGEEQIPGELAAYNPLIPQGRELVATIMFEIENPVLRASVLARLGGVEHSMIMTIGDRTIRGESESEVERTKADGKTSSVHFTRFRFTDDDVTKFRVSGAKVSLGFDHPEYGHLAALPDSVRQALAEDFD